VSETLKTTVKPTQGVDVWIPCSYCGKATCHHALSFVATVDESPDGDVQVWDNYYILQCGGCKTISFCEQSSNSEDEVFDPQSEELSLAVTTRVYPSRIAGRSNLEHDYLLPYPVNKVYAETRKALANDQPILAGIGIRAIVETVCKNKSAAGDNLEKKIDDLANKGVVTA